MLENCIIRLNLHNSIILAILTKNFSVQRLILFIFITFALNNSIGQNISKVQKELKENPKTRMQNAVILREHYVDFSVDSLFTLGSYILQQGIEDDDVPLMMYGKIILSNYYNQNGKTEISTRYLNECINYYQKRGDIEKLADAQNLLGISYVFSGEYNKAANSFIKSIKNAEKLGENNESFIAQLNLSDVYVREGKLDLAETEVREFIEKCKKLKANNGLRKGYDFLARIYSQRENVDMAIFYYEKSLKLAMKSKALGGKAQSFNNIAIAYFETGQLDLSKEYFTKALEFRTQLNQPKGISESYYNLGDWNFYQEYYEEAIKYYQLSLQVARKNNLNREIADAFEKISMCYEATGNYGKSLEYARKFQEIEAKNYKKNQLNEIDLQRTVYEIEREEQSLKQKKREDKIQNKVNIEQNRGKFIVITFTIIVSLMIVFYFLQNVKKNALQAKVVSEVEATETAQQLKKNIAKWQALESFISTIDSPQNIGQLTEVSNNKINSIGNFQSIQLSNHDFLFWEAPITKLENYILKNYFTQEIGNETDKQKIISILESQQLIDPTKFSYVFVTVEQNQIQVDGKNCFLIQNSDKMSFLSDSKTAIMHSTILISETFKNKLLETENWDKFLSQIDMGARMSDEMVIETMNSCWSELLETNNLGILFFFENQPESIA